MVLSFFPFLFAGPRTLRAGSPAHCPRKPCFHVIYFLHIMHHTLSAGKHTQEPGCHTPHFKMTRQDDMAKNKIIYDP